MHQGIATYDFPDHEDEVLAVLILGDLGWMEF